MSSSGSRVRRRGLRGVVLAATVVASVTVATTGKAWAAPPYRVAIDVRAPDSLRGEITDCLTEGLRTLDDVKIVVDEPLFGLNVVAVDFGVGYAISVVAMQPMKQTLPVQMLGQLLNTTDSPDLPTLQAIRQLKPALEASTSLLGHSVLTGAPDQLAEHCQAIVAGFDQNYLSVYRAAGQ